MLGNEINIVLLQRETRTGKVPVDQTQEFELEGVEFVGGNASDLGIMRVGAVRVAKCFGGYGHGRDQEPVDGEGGDRKGRVELADPVDVYQQN